MFKAVVSNTIYQVIAKFVAAGLTLLTTYYIIQLSGLELYGNFTKIMVLVAVGFTMIDFGLNAAGLRQITSPTQILNITSSIIINRLVLSLGAIIILNLLVWLLPGGYTPEVKQIFWLGSLSILFQGIYSSGNSYFQYTLSYYRSTIAIFVSTLVMTLSTFYFLLHSPTLNNLVLSVTLGYFAMSITTIILLPNSVFHQKIILSRLKNILISSLILGCILIFSTIASKVDTIILGIYRSSVEVGQYGFAYRIFEVILTLPVFIMNAFYPLMLKTKKSLLSTSLPTLALLGLFATVFTYFMAPLITLLKPNLIGSVTLLQILSYSLPLFYLTAPLMWYLISKQKDHSVLLIYFSAAVFNTILNLLFVPNSGAIAAAYNTLATELFIFLFLLYYARREFNLLFLSLWQLFIKLKP